MALFTDEEYRAYGIEPPKPKVVEEGPGVGTRILGNIQAGIGDVQGKVAGLAKTAVQLSQLGQMSEADKAAWDEARKQTEQTWHGMDAAKQVIEHPATSTLGGFGESLVRFAPQIPLYAGAGAVLGPVAGAGLRAAHLPGAATWLTSTGGGLASSTLRAAVRGGMEGGAVGLASAREGERLKEAGEEAAGFAMAAPVFHLAGKAIGYGAKKLVKGLTAQQPQVGELRGMKSRSEAPEIYDFYKQGETETTFDSWKKAKSQLDKLRGEGEADMFVVKDKTYNKYYLAREQMKHPVAPEAEADLSGIDRPQEIKQEPGKPPVRVVDKTEMEKPLSAAEMTEGEFKARKPKPFEVAQGPWASERDRFQSHLEAAVQGSPEMDSVQTVKGTMWMMDHLAKRLGMDAEKMYGQVSAEGFAAGMKDKAGADVYGQIWSENGRHVLQLFGGSNTSTLMHESWHLAERFLDAETRLRMSDILIKDAAKVKQMGLELNIKNPYAEYFARSFEEWLKTGKSSITDPKIIGVFQKVKQWLVDVYGHVKSNVVGLSPEVDKFFGEFFDHKETVVATRKAALAAQKAAAEEAKKAKLAELQAKQQAKTEAAKAKMPTKQKAKVEKPKVEEKIKEPEEILAAKVEEPAVEFQGLSAEQAESLVNQRAAIERSMKGDVTGNPKRELAAFDAEMARRGLTLEGLKEQAKKATKAEEPKAPVAEEEVRDEFLDAFNEIKTKQEVGPLFEQDYLDPIKDFTKIPETLEDNTDFIFMGDKAGAKVIKAITRHPDDATKIVKENLYEISPAEFNENFAQVTRQTGFVHDEMGFRRRLDEAIQKMPFEKIAPKKLISMLEREVKKGTLKAEELEWSSIRDMLEATVDEKITKQQALEAAAATGLKLREIKFGELSPMEREQLKNMIGGRLGLEKIASKRDRMSIREIHKSGGADRYNRVTDFINDVYSQLYSKALNLEGKATPEYSRYTVPGGTNHREFLIQMEGDYKFRDSVHWRHRTSESGLAPSENIVGWIRTSDRVGPNGEKVLFIEEIQSQWQLEGRKKGFKPRNINEALKQGYKIEEVEADLIEPKYVVYDKTIHTREQVRSSLKKGDDSVAWAQHNDIDAAVGYVEDMKRFYKGELARGGVRPEEIPELTVTAYKPEKVYKVITPDGQLASSQSPSLKDAQQTVMYVASQGGIARGPFGEGGWQQLTLKRALQTAAKEGYDRVAWVDGKTTADHYSLRNHISQITAVNRPSNPAYYSVYFDDLQGNRIQRLSKSYTKSELSDLLPSEIVDKIVSAKSTPANPVTLSGLDLEVGGKWAEALYDKAVPDTMKKLTKEQPEKLLFDLEHGEVKYFDSVKIKDEFREKMDTEGFSLFQKGLPPEDSPGWTEYIKEIEKAIMNKEPVTIETLRKTQEYSDLIKQTYEDKLAFQAEKIKTEMSKIEKPELQEAKAMEQYADSEHMRGSFEILNNTISKVKGASEAEAKRQAQLVQAVKANSAVLERLSQAAEKPDFLKAVNVAELKKLSGRDERATASEMIADLKLASDSFIKMFRDDPKWLLDNPAKAARAFDHFERISEAVNKWDERIESAQMSWLYDPKMQSRRWLKGAWAVAADDLFSTKNPTVLKALTKVNGMHWLAKKFPVLQPIYELQWKRLEDATILAGDIMKGSMEMPVEWKGKTFNLDGFAPLYRLIDKDPTAYEWTKKLLWAGDKLSKRFSQEEVSAMTKEAFGQPRQDVIAAYEAVRNTQDWMFAKLMTYLTQGVDDPKKVEALEKELAEKIKYHAGYVPHTREGKWSLVVFENARKNDALHMERMPNYYDATKRLEQLKKEYPDREVRLLPVRDAIRMGITAKQELVSVLDELMKTTGTEESVADALRAAAVEMIKEKGYWSHFKAREDIPGYDLRLGRVLHQQAQEFAGFMSKMEFAKQGWQELSQLRAGGYNELHNYGRDWFDLMLRSSDATDQFFGRLRSALFLKYLGLNIKSALVSVAEKATNVPYFLSFYTDNPHQVNMKATKDIVSWVKWKKDAARFIKENQMTDYKYNWRDAMKDVPLPENITMEEAQALRHLFHKGATRAQFMQELSAMMEGRWEQPSGEPASFGKAQDYIDKIGSHAMKYGTSLISFMEQMGRESTALAAFRIFKDKGYGFDKAVRMAERLVLDSHFMYGKANQPLWLNKGGVNRLAKLALTFRTQEMNYLQMLGHMLDMPGKKGVMAAGKSLLTLAALGGGTALPFFAGVDKALTMATGTSPSAAIRKRLDDMTDGDYLGELFASGMPGLLGINMAGSMRVGGDFTLSEMLGGAAGSAAKDLAAGAKSVTEGDWMTAMEKLMPMVAANPVKAYERYKYGVTTGRGNPVTMAPGEEILKLSGAQALTHMLGFQPAELSKAYEREGVRVRTDDYWKSKRSSIYKTIKKGMVRGDSAAIDRAFERVAEFNQSIPASVSPITAQSIKQSLSERPQLRKVLQSEELFGSAE